MWHILHPTIKPVAPFDDPFPFLAFLISPSSSSNQSQIFFMHKCSQNTQTRVTREWRHVFISLFKLFKLYFSKFFKFGPCVFLFQGITGWRGSYGRPASAEGVPVAPVRVAVRVGQQHRGGGGEGGPGPSPHRLPGSAVEWPQSGEESGREVVKPSGGLVDLKTELIVVVMRQGGPSIPAHFEGVPHPLHSSWICVKKRVSKYSENRVFGFIWVLLTFMRLGGGGAYQTMSSQWK